MAYQYVKATEADTPAAAAIELYNMIEASPFNDLERNVLVKLVEAATGYQPAGFAYNKLTGEVYTDKPEPGATDGKKGSSSGGGSSGGGGSGKKGTGEGGEKGNTPPDDDTDKK